MESPPLWSTVSEDDGSRLTLATDLISSGSGCHLIAELLDSKGEDRPLIQESLFYHSDRMCNANFNPLKKALAWPELTAVDCDSKHLAAIKPPLQFQDSPPSPLNDESRVLGYRYKLEQIHIDPPKCNIVLPWLDKFASQLASTICEEACAVSYKTEWSIHCSEDCHPSDGFRQRQIRGTSSHWNGPRLCWTPELLSFSPCHNRPGSRLSSSHNSLAANKADDSSFITSAMSHDVLMVGEITDMYNVPFDSDIYAVPIDMVRPLHEPRTPQRPKRHQRHHRKRRRHTSSSSQLEVDHIPHQGHKTKNTNILNSSQLHILKPQRSISPDTSSDPGKRHSVPGSSAGRQMRSDRSEPIHMTLQEVRQYLQNLYSSSSDSSEHKPKVEPPSPKHTNNNDPSLKGINSNFVSCVNNNVRKHKKSTFVINIKNKKAKESCEIHSKDKTNLDLNNDKDKLKKNSSRLGFSSNLKQTLCNIFRIRKPPSPEHVEHGRRAVVLQVVEEMDAPNNDGLIDAKAPFLKRALPPLPATHPDCITTDSTAIPSPEDTFVEGEDVEEFGEEPSMDFASSIEKVKDYGWYWGPISGEAAEKILSNEPDGSFIVRDSSDDHYIFSLTFKLNGCIRHVRIEHDQGNFSFGSCTKFKSHTIVDFIENAVEHSRSGRYLFFLHRRPVLGPMRVQLLHPVSRFKQVQSLQHMCRFVILKLVRKDLINTLPLPRRVIDYMSTPHYYSEQLIEDDSNGPSPSPDEVVHVLSFVPQGLS